MHRTELIIRPEGRLDASTRPTTSAGMIARMRASRLTSLPNRGLIYCAPGAPPAWATHVVYEKAAMPEDQSEGGP
jgi:hypothetical protein